MGGVPPMQPGRLQLDPSRDKKIAALKSVYPTWGFSHPCKVLSFLPSSYLLDLSHMNLQQLCFSLARTALLSSTAPHIVWFKDSLSVCLPAFPPLSPSFPSIFLSTKTCGLDTLYSPSLNLTTILLSTFYR